MTHDQILSEVRARLKNYASVETSELAFICEEGMAKWISRLVYVADATSRADERKKCFAEERERNAISDHLMFFCTKCFAMFDLDHQHECEGFKIRVHTVPPDDLAEEPT